MTLLIVTSVLDDIEEWQNRYGDFMYTVTAFAGKERIRCSKKDRDRALELQGLLQEAIGEEREYIVEDDGISQNGNQKWKLVGFKASQNGHSNGNGHVPMDGRALALQTAAVYAQGQEWGLFEKAFRRIYALLGGIPVEDESVSGTDQGAGDGLNGQV